MKLNKLIYIVLLTAILPIALFSQTKYIKKAQKAYESNEYDDAWQYLNLAVIEEEDEIISNYYLAKINSNSDFKNKNLFRAFAQIYLADSLVRTKGNSYLEELNDVIPDGKSVIGKTRQEIDDQLFEFVNNSKDIILVDRIAGECSSSSHYREIIETRNRLEFEKVKKKDEVGSYNLFMERFANSEFVEKANLLRNSAAFYIVKKENTVEAYDEFILKYGNAIQFDSAIELRNKRAFEDALEANTLSQYEHYLQYYPGSFYIDTVIFVRNALEFRLKEKENTLDSYQEYISKYPYSKDAPAAIDARNYLEFEKANSTLDLGTRLSYLNDFVYNLPNAVQIERAKFLRDSIAYEIAIRTKNSVNDFNDYLEDYPLSTYTSKIIHVRDSLLMRKLESFGDLELFNRILNNYPYFQFKKQAEIVRNKLAFDLAVKEDTQEALQRFIDFYPYAEQIEKAKKMLSNF
jgi:outer membrane protein assembly factor BamD (BamD/ComL family)